MDTNKKKFTDTQLRIIQIVIGVVAAAALFISILLPARLTDDTNSLLNYAFVVIFLVIMMGRRTIENKYRLRLTLFSLALMDGVLGAIIIFAANGFYSDDTMIQLDNWIKLLIIIALSILLLVLGILLPLLRYSKRKANGTVPPIRIPENPEPDEPEKIEDDPNRPLTVAEKIAAMSNELEQTNSDGKKFKVSDTEEENK